MEEKRHQQMLTDALNNKETTLQFKGVSDYKISQTTEDKACAVTIEKL